MDPLLLYNPTILWSLSGAFLNREGLSTMATSIMRWFFSFISVSSVPPWCIEAALSDALGGAKLAGMASVTEDVFHVEHANEKLSFARARVYNGAFANRSIL